VATGQAAITDAERTEIDRLLRSAGASERLGMAAADAEALGRAALDGIGRWRARAANPLTDRATGEAAEIIVRMYEGLYVDVRG
jgi:hypothetical protein